MDEQLFVGVDGGGTGCRAIIATQSRVLGAGRGGPANVSTNTAGAIASVLVALEQARAAAGGMSLRDARGHIGLAGVLTSEQAQTVAAALPMQRAVVTDDRPTMIAGALGDADGAVAAIGTGSFIGARRANSYQFAGGWGLVLGDDASAAWLGRAGLAETLLAQDGLRAHSALSREILDHFGGDPNEIVAFAATATPSGFGRFAPRVSAAAQEGDALGLSLMQRGAAYIAAALKAVNHRAVDPLCLTGGLGPAYATYLKNALDVNIAAPGGTALDGALALARALA